MAISLSREDFGNNNPAGRSAAFNKLLRLRQIVIPARANGSAQGAARRQAPREPGIHSSMRFAARWIPGLRIPE
jgi:hypothetical protein